jgi:pyruvate/2-oxoglutarate dehydrogenase complex dihydrolipoamide acyltransferase (E2) component
MAEIVAMPKLGFDMAEGKRSAGAVRRGDSEKGQVLAEIETDKATVEVEAAETIVRSIWSGRTSVPVGSAIAIIACLTSRQETAPRCQLRRS